jgi:hypothetical protein
MSSVDILIRRERYTDVTEDGERVVSGSDYEVRDDLTLTEAIGLTRMEGATFTGGSDYAVTVDHAVIDYATLEREEVTVFPQGAWHSWEVEAWKAGVNAERLDVMTFPRIYETGATS